MATHVIDAMETTRQSAIDILNAKLEGVKARLDALEDGDGRERLEGHRESIERNIREIQQVKNSVAEMRKEPHPYPGAGTIWDEAVSEGQDEDEPPLDQDDIE